MKETSYCSYCRRPCRPADRTEEISDFYHGSSGLQVHHLQVSDCCGDEVVSRNFVLTSYLMQRSSRNINTINLKEV